jgi:aspartate oxidase
MTPVNYQPVDVLVIGAGNAAANAALAAHEAGCTVAMLETAPESARGGNSAFTGGAFRFVYQDVKDLLALDPTIAELDLSSIDFGTYTQEQYFDDMGRLTEYRCDPDLTEVLIGNSYASALWLKKHGVKFQPALGRQAFKVDGKFRFWGGLACHIHGGGQHLVATLHAKLAQVGIPVLYDTTAWQFLHGDDRVEGVRVRHHGKLLRSACESDRHGLRRLRVERGDARPLYRSQLGSREGARHAIQSRLRPPHGDGYRRRRRRALVRSARRAMGHERTPIRRSDGRRSVSEA